MCPFLVTYRSQAPLAQLVEQLTLNQLVEGSSPSWCTNLRFATIGRPKGLLFIYLNKRGGKIGKEN